MYCPACRQERLGSARQCVLCGTHLSARARSAIEAELAHVHFLLDEVPRWDASDVPPHVRRLLTERYERQARVLLSVLTETPAESLTPTPDAVQDEAVTPRMGEGAFAVGPVSFVASRGPEADAATAFAASDASVVHVAGEDASAVASEAYVAHGMAVEANVVEVASAAHAFPSDAHAFPSDAHASVDASGVAAHALTDATAAHALADAAASASSDASASVAHTLTDASDAATSAAHALPNTEATPDAAGASAVHFSQLDVSASLGIATPVSGLPHVAKPGPNVAHPPVGASARPMSAARPLPPNPGEPFMDPPAPSSRTARIVEETSAWSRVWRPFLYESIAWFIGAFLILSGTLYFVFESWAGMTSVTRSLTVFVMTVGYSVGFSVWGGYLSRRESLRKPGHILGLIGSAVAPLGGVALGPMGFGESLQLDGVHPALLVPLLFVWAGVAAFLARKPAEAFDAPSRPFIQVGLVGATLIMGLAPLAARIGAPAVWLNALPCLLFFLLSRKAVTPQRSGDALAFALTAPLYLTALFAIRLHLSLASAGAPVPAGTYAPFVAFLLATCLRFRTLEAERSADSLSVGTVGLQVACLAAAIKGTQPALFLTAAIFTGTLVSLSKGTLARLKWLYPAYFGAYLSYASSVQLVPNAARLLLNALKARLGYPPAEVLPFQYGALTAIPFVLAGLVLAFLVQRRGERTGDTRDLGLSDVLLRATTWAAPAFALYGHLGTDARPAFFATLALGALSLGAGLLFKRFPLSAVGSVLFALLPFSGVIAFGAGPATLVAGALALGLALLVWRLEDARTQRFLGTVVGVLATCGFAIGVVSSPITAPVVGMALGSAGVLLAAFRLRHEGYLAFGAFLAVAILPKLGSVHSTQAALAAMVGGALVLALLGERGGLLKRLGVPALLYAGSAVLWGLMSQQPFLGPVLLTAAATMAVASRSFPDARPFAVVLVGISLLPDLSFYSAWGLPPAVSLVLLIAASFLGSVVAAHKGRSASTVTAGILALLLPLVPAEMAGPGHQTLFLLGAALAALLTTRALPPTLGLLMATIEAGVALYTAGPLALLGLATFLSVLALLDDVPAVRRIATGGESFSLVSTLAAMVVLGASTVCWNGHALARLPHATLLALMGPALLPLLWTRTLRQPFAAALMVPYGMLSIAAVMHPPAWVALLPLYPLLLVRAVEHVPSAASWLLRSREEAPRQAMSKWMQLAVSGLGALSLLVSDVGQRTALVSALALVLLPGPRPSIRVGVASVLLMFIPEARPFATVLLLALALASHHVPDALAAFFRGPRDESLRPTAVSGALCVMLISVLTGPTPGALAASGGVLLAAAFLLSQRWLLTAAVGAFALAPLGQTSQFAVGEWRPEAGLLVVGVALVASVLSALCQSGAVQRALTNAAARLTPGIEGTWSEPLWVGGAGVAALLVGLRLADAGPGALPLPVALVAGLTSLVLMVTRERLMMNGATALLGAVLLAAVPPLWTPAVLAGVGLVLALVGFGLEVRGVAVGSALHHGGAVLALLSLGSLRSAESVEHVSMPLSVLFGLATAWTVVARRREREWLGWSASLFAVHAFIVHFGAVYSTGRGAEFIFPYFGAATALLATLVLSVAGPKVRGRMGRAFAGLALVEVLLGVLTVRGPDGASREAWVACGGLVILLFALVRRAAKDEDEAAAWMAQALVATGYLCVRVLGLNASLGTADSLASLIGGAVFIGLYLFVRREGAGLKAFRRPAIAGAWWFPLAGLLSLPWGQPFVAVALLVGYAAHFAALASASKEKGPASVMSVAAFNLALFFVWLGTGTGEPQYYAIPAGLSVLALLRTFRSGLSQDAYAQLRAIAVTCIYVAGAWKPLLFNDGEAMLLCVFLCLVGVGAGVALRIRSYVYLGSGFLVTAVAANLVRFGMRDHRVGAAFLSLLGLLVVGFMVVLSAHRAALLQRYARVRELLGTWEG
ncbi:hypothetical protein OV208_00910 [Corallococcus sp. bb12-1]|uniref:hypothetical protein n=1 Tax=Corallococcus sp. bb12-1 TaxID=2996784 RepID=UPI00226FEF72|nr:hypothetical protein [Corallococcus sp. bb12-1]MCY1039860.1 hypothetical protein [Corallococcus sp. bb12-1]